MLKIWTSLILWIYLALASVMDEVSIPKQNNVFLHVVLAVKLILFRFRLYWSSLPNEKSLDLDWVILVAQLLYVSI